MSNNKQNEKRKQRTDFCRLALNEPKKAAKKLRSMSLGLANCRRPDDVIKALSDIFYCSERTIERDIKSE